MIIFILTKLCKIKKYESYYHFNIGASIGLWSIFCWVQLALLQCHAVDSVTCLFGRQNKYAVLTHAM